MRILATASTLRELIPTPELPLASSATVLNHSSSLGLWWWTRGE